MREQEKPLRLPQWLARSFDLSSAILKQEPNGIASGAPLLFRKCVNLRLLAQDNLFGDFRNMKTTGSLDRFDGMRWKLALGWWPYVAIVLSLLGLLYIALEKRSYEPIKVRVVPSPAKRFNLDTDR